jgi:hypothetical protein
MPFNIRSRPKLTEINGVPPAAGIYYPEGIGSDYPLGLKTPFFCFCEPPRAPAFYNVNY